MIESPVRTIPVTKDEFITALRSGDHEQIIDGRMYAENGMCAMGLLDHLAGNGRLNGLVGNTKVLGFVPVKVFNRIAELNDDGLSFHQIADLLELYLSDDFQSLSC